MSFKLEYFFIRSRYRKVRRISLRSARSQNDFGERAVALYRYRLNKKGISTPYKSTHMKHPCVLWVEASYDNFEWLVQLALALNNEYRYRFERSQDHKSIAVLNKIANLQYERNGLTPFPQAMPEQFKVPNNPIQAYRNFYIGEKMSFAKWTKREMPYWILTDHDH